MNYLIKEIKLNNGARGLIIDYPGARTVYNEIAFNAGYWQINDFEHKQQIPHIYEHMATNVRGYGSKAAFDLAVTKNGAIRNASTSNEFVRFFTMSAKFDYERVLGLQCQMLGGTDLNDKTFIAEKKNIANELSARLNSPIYTLIHAVKSSFGIHDMTPDGALVALDNINLSDIIDYRNDCITSSNMKFIIAGDFRGDYSKIIGSYEHIDIPIGEPKLFPEWTLHDGGAFTIQRSDTKQSTARLSFAMPRVFTTKDGAAMAIIHRLLVVGMRSRVFGKARAKGLVYSLSQDTESTAGYTIMSFNFAYKDENLDALLKLIASELCNLRDGGLSDGELEAAKCSIAGAELMSYETPRSVAKALFRRYLRLGEIRDLDGFADVVRSITADDVAGLVDELIRSGRIALGLYGNVTDDRAKAARDMVLDRLV